MEKMKKISLVFIPMLLLSVSILLPAVSNADPDRFVSTTALYIVETQTDVDNLPDTIDVTSTGKIIAILVKGSGLAIEDKSIIGPYGSMTGDCIGIAVDGQLDTTVKNCEIDGFTLGIYYYASSGKIIHNDIFDYGKNGITSNMPSSDGGAVNIFWNTVTGRSPLPLGDWAQNGIQIGWGAKGNVKFNTVEDHWYIAPDWTATGILIFEADDCIVQGNTLTDNQWGIAIETWAWYPPYHESASGNKVVKNTITVPNEATLGKGLYGVSVLSVAWSGNTEDDPIADNNKAVNNVIQDQEVGILVGTSDDDTGDDYDPSADNNKVIRNKFTDVDTDISNTGTETKIHANVIYP